MTSETQLLAVRILRFVDDAFPGWVECQFTDALGRFHTIIDKYPYFTAQMLDGNSQYPQTGEVECEVLDRSLDAREAELIRVRMRGTESTEGLSEFVVSATQLSVPVLPSPRAT
jgi:hypothetical protein